MNNAFWCYIIQNTEEKYKNYTYVGFTTNPARRLRQHNREIKGGAKATKLGGDWKFIALITGFKTNHNALSCEWKLKHPDGKRKKAAKYCGLNGRVITLNEILCLDKWTEKSDMLNKECNFDVYVDQQIFGDLNIALFPPNINVSFDMPF